MSALEQAEVTMRARDVEGALVQQALRVAGEIDGIFEPDREPCVVPDCQVCEAAKLLRQLADALQARRDRD